MKIASPTTCAPMITTYIHTEVAWLSFQKLLVLDQQGHQDVTVFYFLLHKINIVPIVRLTEKREITHLILVCGGKEPDRLVLLTCIQQLSMC